MHILASCAHDRSRTARRLISINPDIGRRTSPLQISKSARARNTEQISTFPQVISVAKISNMWSPVAFAPHVTIAARKPFLSNALSRRTRGKPAQVMCPLITPTMVATEPAVTGTGYAENVVQVKPTKHDLFTGRDPNRVRIFDTTLRDGEQSPGATLTPDEKMVIAKQLAKLGVDIIEAGFPIASEGDFRAVEAIAKVVGNRAHPPIICGLARALEKDISRCYEAVKHAAFPRIHTFIATSDVHMEYKLRKSREEILDIVKNMVSYARSLCEDVEFSAEDALRTDPDFLCEVFSTAIEAGATTINVPDTVGYTTPSEFGELIRRIRRSVRGVDDVIISVHGHDDLGMAVANFLSAVENGARQTEVTINGIGERAGNASLEEVAMGAARSTRFLQPQAGSLQ